MKNIKYILTLLFLANSFLIFADKTKIEVLQDNPSYTIVELTTGTWYENKVQTPKGIYSILKMENTSSYLLNGAPDFPKITFSLAIPEQVDVNYEILESHYTDFENKLIAPSKGSVLRTQKKSDIPYYFGEEYNKNEFYPSQTIQLSSPYILRDINGQSLHVFPFQYNPITKTLRVYHDLKIKINYINPNTKQANTKEIKPTLIDETFLGIYENQFKNFNQIKKTRYTPITENGSLLVLSPSKFLNDIKPFVQWKEMKGFKTILVDVDTLSGGVTEDNIRNIANYYYSKNQIAFMLIVGDNGDIPAANSNFNNPNLAGPSDISYAYITGNDHYPEFVVGRFSGETSVEIQNMVNRTLAYEKTPNTFGNWMTQQIGIASEEGTGDDGQYDYEHIHEIVDSNVNLGNYTYYYELYDGVQSKGWNDAPGFPTANDLKNLINSGASLINYTGHGGATGIVTTGFNISNVPTLNNSNKLPFFYVVGCSPGRFYNQTCFAEELMRAGNVNDAFGTISNFMSTIDQYWDEPMEAQDEFNGIMRGGRPNNLQSRLGAMCVNSCCAMNDKYNTWADPTGGSDMTDTWIFFGDPTVSLYNKNNGTITCTHTAEIGVNSTWYSVNCPVEGATVGLYYLGKYLASSKVTGGVATFTFPPIANLDTVFITVTKQNYTPYFGYTKVVTFPNNIKQLENDNILSVYPNPATEFTIIKSNEKPIQHIQLLDLKGSILFEETLNNQEYRLNTKLYPKGNYLLKIFTPNNSLLRKLRIE